MKKKLRLKRKVKEFLLDLLVFVIIGTIFSLVFIGILKEFNKRANKCDLEKGYTCSINELVVRK